MPLSDPLRIANVYLATASGVTIYGVKSCEFSTSKEIKAFSSDANLGAMALAGTYITGTGTLTLADKGSPHTLCDGVVKYVVLTWKGNDGVANKTTIGAVGPPLTGMLFTGWTLHAEQNDASGSGFYWTVDFVLVFGTAATSLTSLMVNLTA